MKKAAIVLMVLVLAVGGVIGYALFQTNLQVLAKGLQRTPAAERRKEFEALKQAAEGQRLMGTVLKKEGIGQAENYSLYTYTLRLKNNCLVDAEMVEMQISPASGDVLFYGSTQEIVIPAGKTKDISCVLLTEGTPRAVREIYVTYYLWGHPKQIKFTFDD